MAYKLRDADPAVQEFVRASRRFTRGVARILPRCGPIPAARRDPMAHLFFLRSGLAAVRTQLADVEQIVRDLEAR